MFFTSHVIQLSRLQVGFDDKKMDLVFQKLFLAVTLKQSSHSAEVVSDPLSLCTPVMPTIKIQSNTVHFAIFKNVRYHKNSIITKNAVMRR